MQIKSTKSFPFLRNLLLLGGVMAVLFLVAAFVQRSSGELDSGEKTVTGSLPVATADFMRKKASFFELLEFFHDHTILLAVQDDASAQLGPGARERLGKMGGEKLAQLALRSSYAGLFQHGKITAEVASETDSVSLAFPGGKVYSGGQRGGSFSRLQLGHETWYGHGRGLNVFVIGKTGVLLGSWHFDFFAEKNPLSTTHRYVPGFYENVPTLEIELKEAHFAKLEKKRDEAMQAQLLLVEEDDPVPAEIIFDGKKQKGKIRLKGDWVDHLMGDNWSFRVRLDANGALMGMRKFSLHRPETRNYAGEWLFHEMLREADILNLQYHFVQVKLTIRAADGAQEKMLGLYALEEFFDKHLVERGRRREGVILKIDESALWDERAAFFAAGIDDRLIPASSVAENQNLPVVPFAQSKVMADPLLSQQFETAAALFRDFLDGKKRTHEVFDVERLAMFTAIANLLGANHAVVPHNIRVYFNPVTARFEPIGFDGNAWSYTGYFSPYMGTEHDPVYHAAYLAALEKVTAPGYLEKFAHWPGLSEKLELMALAYPQVNQSFETLNANRGTIRNSIFPQRSLKVFFEKIENGHLHLTVENFGRFPVEILGVENDEGRPFGRLRQPFVLPRERHNLAIKLNRNFERLFVEKGKRKAGFNVRLDFEKIKLTYKTLGTSILRNEEIHPWSASAGEKTADLPPLARPNAHEYDFLVFNEKEKTITAQPGHWRLGSPIVVPPGYTFRAGPGTRFDFMDYNGRIVSQSPLDFRGTAASPVEVISQSGKGLGLFVYHTADTSHLEFCHFKKLSNPETKGWALTGAVNFYEAPVSLRHCRFSENRCEDALNIFRSWFELEQVVFSDIHADAFDGDFVHGEVKNCQFIRIGNDAIDVSGSTVRVENVTIFGAGDKGLSAGEGSTMTAQNISIENSEIALASKDNSTLAIAHSRLKNNALGFTAFQKKPEFGPAQITADSLESEGNQTEFLIETHSTLLLNGQKMPTENGVIERMYGGEFGKKS